MNYSENFKITHMISRTIAFIIYFAASGFAGVICGVILNSVMRIALRDNPALKDMILYAVSLCVISACLYYFSKRDGGADTQSLRFSFLKTIICYAAAAVIFFSLIVLSDMLIFSRYYFRDSFFREYFFSPYYLDAHIRSFTQIGIPDGYALAAALIILNTGAMALAYMHGRRSWMAGKRKRIEKLRVS